MIFYYLLLGHLLGDFTFQTDKIANNKTKDLSWIILHSIIVTFNMLIFAIPFGYKLMGLVMVNGILHFLIDYYKAKIPTKSSLQHFFYFILDQTLHIGIIFFIAFFFNGKKIILLFNDNTVIFLIAFIFIFSFSTIFIQMILKILFPMYNKEFFMKNERTIGNFIRTIAFFIFCFSLYYSVLILLFIPFIIIITIVIYLKEWNTWMSLKYFGTKITLDIIMSMIGFTIILLI